MSINKSFENLNENDNKSEFNAELKNLNSLLESVKMREMGFGESRDDYNNDSAVKEEGRVKISDLVGSSRNSIVGDEEEEDLGIVTFDPKYRSQYIQKSNEKCDSERNLNDCQGNEKNIDSIYNSLNDSARYV